MKKKQIAVILSGCGVYDGSEIHEATLSLYAISKLGAEYQIFAPDIDQHHVINHITGEEMAEKRNVLVESARIARGNIKSLDKLNQNDFDAIIFPGGFGVAKNLCNFAFKGTDCQVDSSIENLIKSFHSAGKPIGALCISPVLIARVLHGVEVTIGEDAGTAKAIETFGAKHNKTKHGEVTVDKKNKIVTNPCYMLNSTIAQIGEGAENVVKAILELV
ncbi:MAG: isoprenoid biosynthesis glyoxalase ElbB [Bacteroidales bacterium]|nr:isoprenoid biosynthesis glyoxalase ElbB [Bacteroidales bacterium]